MNNINALYILYFLIYLIHFILWLFVVFAFLNKKTAIFNIYILIPIIYISHIFAGCLLDDVENY